MASSITFSPDGWADYLYWQTEDKKTLRRINRLLQELQRDGAGAASGLGKPEVMRHVKQMSRHIDDKNRLVYSVENGTLVIISCRGHYED